MSLRIEEVGPLVTVQDRGRSGWAHLGVPRAGALDAPAADLANRLVGNDADAAVLEIMLGGFAARLEESRWVAVTGAPGSLTVAGRPAGHARAEWVPAGGSVRIAAPTVGVRSYLAVAGGIAVTPVLGSRATDTLAGVGPEPIRAGDAVPLGEVRGAPRPLDVPPPAAPGPLSLLPGPRTDWFAPDTLDRLCAGTYRVAPESDRIGMRLDGPALERVRHDELPSEGMVLGAVQVPPSGRPVVFLADHPTTGGYPVVAVVAREDLWRCAQARPGEEIGFTRARG